MFRLLFAATLGSAIGTYATTIALTADIDASDELDVVGGAAVPRHVHAEDLRRPLPRPADRPALAQDADRRLRPRAADRLRSSAVRAPSGHDDRARGDVRHRRLVLPSRGVRRCTEPRRRARSRLCDDAPPRHRVARRCDRPGDRRYAREPFGPPHRLLVERGDVPLLGAAAPPHPRPPSAERAGNLARSLARPARGIHRVPLDGAARRALRLRLDDHRVRARQRQRDLPRDEVARVEPRLRLRIALDRVRHRSRRRQHRDRLSARAAQRARHLRPRVRPAHRRHPRRCPRAEHLDRRDRDDDDRVR